MQIQEHRLIGSPSGTQRTLTTLHFGAGARRAYLQASLHADEVPAMLVAQHLRRRLAELEAQGRLRGEIVLAPACNPLGLSQQLFGRHQGRFEHDSGHNFNRHYPDLVAQAIARVQLGDNAAQNTETLRQAMLQALAEHPVQTELQHLRKILLGHALAAEVVLDLHCDNEGVMHLYSVPEQAQCVRQLGACLQAEVALLANESGDSPFDEACSGPWLRLQQHYQGRHPVNLGCFAATVEHRGVCDVRHDLAAQDAEGLLRFLGLQGFISGMDAPSAHDCALVPLAGSLPVTAPHAGVVVFTRPLGGPVRQGEVLAELIDPVSGHCSELRAPVDGIYYRREQQRWVQAGATVVQVAGREALRSGKLLSA
ncbi:hypothetical protein HNQ51_003493 [Inhella inkyongensis]|uniref:Succinylglutamate desuccinylase/Aspartoacylase catalytic domain-containing protein n=1 Tax=Inhella inkyongensis TaxID=392593 RepID=A0A840SCS9_9BURK|nr:succinylglutamate desuccinylase/aspartoacylase family protein [Inhella inkyongensis]MBB5206150.1 hypothetical protein [Inhella inkyongensis]